MGNKEINIPEVDSIIYLESKVVVKFTKSNVEIFQFFCETDSGEKVLELKEKNKNEPFHIHIPEEYRNVLLKLKVIARKEDKKLELSDYQQNSLMWEPFILGKKNIDNTHIIYDKKQNYQQQQKQQQYIVTAMPGEHVQAYINFLKTNSSDKLNSSLQVQENNQILHHLIDPMNIKNQLLECENGNVNILLFYYHNQTRTEGTEGKLIQLIQDIEQSLKELGFEQIKFFVVNLIGSNVFCNFENLQVFQKITVKIICQTDHEQKVIVSKQLEPSVQTVMTFLEKII